MGDIQKPIVKKFMRGDVLGPYIDECEAIRLHITTLEGMIFKSYCAGYEAGNGHGVDDHYAPPVDYPEEWEEIVNDLRAEAEDKTPRFDMVYCSHCGGAFGPGDNGYSHCEGHEGQVNRDH